MNSASIAHQIENPPVSGLDIQQESFAEVVVHDFYDINKQNNPVK
jgi:hypothetical protein